MKVLAKDKERNKQTKKVMIYNSIVKDSLQKFHQTELYS